MRFVSLAFRNMLRNVRRSTLTLFVFAVGVAALVIAWSVFDGSNAQVIRGMTGNYTGYVQIHRQGYTDDASVDRAFAAQDVAASRVGDIPGIVAAAPRMETMALVSSAGNARGLRIVGIDPELEPSVTVLHQRLVAGRYLDKTETGSMLIGKALAKVLDVGVGDEVAVLTQGMQGSIGAQRYRIAGIYSTGNEMVDGMQAFITMADASALLSSGGQITTIAIKLADRAQTDTVVQTLGGRLGKDFEVIGWKKLLPEVAESVEFHEVMGKLVTLILFGIVGIGVTNTVLMSALERRREFGVMMALGTSPWQVFRIIIYEGLLLGLSGFGIGFMLGYAAVAYLGAAGIDLGEGTQTMQGLARVIHPTLSAERILYICSAVFVVIAAASLYPAWKIVRLTSLDAIRGNPAGRKDTVRTYAGGAGFAARLLLLSLAIRNFTRHPVRTGLTVLTISVGVSAFVFVAATANGYYAQVVANATGMFSGDAQVQHKDFKDDMQPGFSLPDGVQLLGQLRQAHGVAAASPRVQSMAMITSPAKSLPLMLVGVDPGSERETTFLHKAVTQGRYLRQGGDKEIVIGRRLAELLHVRIGERVVVMAQDLGGSLVSEGFVVAGMFNTGSHGIDDGMAQITLTASQKILGINGKITNIALRLQGDDAQRAAALQKLAAVVPPGESRLLTWQQLLPQVAQISALLKHAQAVLLTIVLLMVSVVIMNTVLMSVMERTREFGTMLALGSRPGFIVRLVQLESGVLGVLGTLCGLALGGLLTAFAMHTGIDIQMHGASIPGVTNIIHPQLSVVVLALPGVLLPVLALLAALYPALRASRLEPVRAIRHA